MRTIQFFHQKTKEGMMRLVHQDCCQIHTSLTTLSITHERPQTHTNTEFNNRFEAQTHSHVCSTSRSVHKKAHSVLSPDPPHFHSPWQSGQTFLIEYGSLKWNKLLGWRVKMLTLVRVGRSPRIWGIYVYWKMIGSYQIHFSS